MTLGDGLAGALIAAYLLAWLLGMALARSNPRDKEDLRYWGSFYLTMTVLWMIFFTIGYMVTAKCLDVATPLSRRVFDPFAEWTGGSEQIHYPPAPVFLWVAFPGILICQLFFWRSAGRVLKRAREDDISGFIHGSVILSLGALGVFMAITTSSQIIWALMARGIDVGAALTTNTFGVLAMSLPLAGLLWIDRQSPGWIRGMAIPRWTFVLGMLSLGLVFLDGVIVSMITLLVSALNAGTAAEPVELAQGVSDLTIGLAIWVTGWTWAARPYRDGTRLPGRGTVRRSYLLAVVLIICLSGLKMTSLPIDAWLTQAAFPGPSLVGLIRVDKAVIAWGTLILVIGGFHAWLLRLDDGQVGPSDVWRKGERLVLLPMQALAGIFSLARLIAVIPLVIRSPRLILSPATPLSGAEAQSSFRLVVTLLIWGYCTWRLSKLRPVSTESRVELVVESIIRYVVGLVGLWILIVGLTGILSVDLQVMISTPIGAGLRDELALSTSVLAFGGLLWGITEYSASRRRPPLGQAGWLLYLTACIVLSAATIMGGVLRAHGPLAGFITQAAPAEILAFESADGFSFAIVGVAALIFHIFLLRGGKTRVESVAAGSPVSGI